MAAARTALCLAAAGLIQSAGPAAAQSTDPWDDLRDVPLDETAVDPLDIPLPQPRPSADAVAGPEALNQPPTGAVGRESASGPSAAAATAIDPITTGSAGRRTAVDDPYAPLGIRVGRHLLLPSVALSAGYTNNASGSAGGDESAVLTVTPRLEIQSDHDGHDTRIVLRGSYEAYTNGSSDARPSAGAEVESRVDLLDGWEMTLAADYSYDQQSLSDPDFPAGVDSAPGIHQYGGGVTLARDVGRVGLEIGARVDRSDYEDGKAGGVTVDQGDRTTTFIEGRARTSFELGGVIEPFVEGLIFHRSYDRRVSSGGLRLEGNGYQVRGGVAINSEPVLSGEVAAGYREEYRVDPALQDLHALTVDGSLVWSPVRLVSVALTSETALNPDDDTASQGSVSYEGSVELTYRPRENIALSGDGALTVERYFGTGGVDYTFSVGAEMTWQINRFVQLDSSYRHEWLDSGDPSRDYQSDTVRVGVTLRK